MSYLAKIAEIDVLHDDNPWKHTDAHAMGVECLGARVVRGCELVSITAHSARGAKRSKVANQLQSKDVSVSPFALSRNVRDDDPRPLHDSHLTSRATGNVVDVVGCTTLPRLHITCA